MSEQVKLLKTLPGISSDHPQATWPIGPVGHHRESTLVEESNWDVLIAALKEVDPEGDDHEVHRFGHFAVGWVEEVAWRPYLSDDDVRGMQWGYGEEREGWVNYSHSDIQAIAEKLADKLGFVFADEIPDPLKGES